MIAKRGLVGHVSPFIDGRTLEAYLADPQGNFIDHLQMAISVAHATAELHERGIIYGDIQTENIMVMNNNDVFKVFLIDFDNFAAADTPPPQMVGHSLYMAPELRAALAQGRHAVPTIGSDCFSLAVMVHELVLLRHVAAGADDEESHFQKAMCAGRWLHDPAAIDRPPATVEGYPSEILNTDLARLFRRAFSLEPDQRPSARQWETALCHAIRKLDICMECHGPCLIDSSKTHCPLCSKPYRGLQLKLVGGGVIPLRDNVVSLGRNELGGSPKVSQCHAVFRRIGPETWMESRGRNGTCRRNGSKWLKLPDRKPILVQRGDVLLFADTEGTLT